MADVDVLKALSGYNPEDEEKLKILIPELQDSVKNAGEQRSPASEGINAETTSPLQLGERNAQGELVYKYAPGAFTELEKEVEERVKSAGERRLEKFQQDQQHL